MLCANLKVSCNENSTKEDTCLSQVSCQSHHDAINLDFPMTDIPIKTLYFVVIIAYTSKKTNSKMETYHQSYLVS